jgi:hypothetical protein
MRKSLQNKLKVLLYTALVAGTIWSCQEEKPAINIPDPYVPPKEFKFVETLTPDTLSFLEGDSAVFSFRTVPYDLLGRRNLTVQINDTAGAKYPYAEIKERKLTADSIWNVIAYMKFGMKTGDVVSVMIADSDTVINSKPIVLNMIPKEQPQYISFNIVSPDSLFGFERNGYANVRVRTTPWDLMFNDSTMLLEIIDTMGVSIDESLCVLEGREFMPDSTWNLRIGIKERQLDTLLLKVRLSIPDTVMEAGPVRLKRISIALSSVRIKEADVTLTYDSKTMSFSKLLPTVTDFSKLNVMLRASSGATITCGDSILEANTYNVMDLRQPVTVTVWNYNLSKDYTIKVSNTGLPVVRIDTKGQSVDRRDTWVEGTTMRIELPDGTVDYEGPLSLKGRGNGTWTETAKKPYALRLDEKAKLLGMHKQKRWCLLANYKDRTLLRNDAAFWLSRHTELPYTVSGRYVELVWNGKHMGNYYLCEQIRIDNHRVDIVNPKLDDPANGGLLIVIDDFLGYSSSDRYDKSPMVGFRSTGANNRYKLPYVLKDPEEDENGNLLTSSSATYKYLFNYVKEMEDAIYNADKSDKWMEYLDMDRAVDYVLIQEMTMNHDSYNTWPNAGPHSAYLYKDSCGLLCYGPVWDFDYHTFTLYNDGSNQAQASGENPRIKQWELLKMDNKSGNNGGWGGGWGGWGGGDTGSSSGNKYYFADLVSKSPKFKSRLIERWNQYKYVWRDSLPAYIDMMADSIRVSESVNISVWASNTSLTNYRQNGDYNLTFQGAVDAMKSAFLKRWEWLDQNLPKL